MPKSTEPPPARRRRPALPPGASGRDPPNSDKPGKAFTLRAPGEDSLGSIAEGTTRGAAAGDHFGAVYGHEFAESIEHPAQRAAFDPSSLENASAGDQESWAVHWTQQAEVTAARAAPTGRQGATTSQKGSRAAGSTFPPKSGEGVDGGAAFMFLSLLEFFINSLAKKNAAPSSSSPVGIAKKTPTPPPTPGRKRPWRTTCPLPPCSRRPRELPATAVCRPRLGCRRFLLQPPGPTRCCRSRAYRLAGAAPVRRQRRPGGSPCWERTASSAGLGGGITLGKQHKEGQVLGSAGRARMSVLRLAVLVPQRVRGRGRDPLEEGHRENDVATLGWLNR
jgi:hypothetical protein